MQINIDCLKIDFFIGVFETEFKNPQTVIMDIKIQMEIKEVNDNYEQVVCYKKIIDKIEDLKTQGHIKLVETLAEKVADICLSWDGVICAEVKVSKPDAISNAKAVGVKILKQK